MIKKSLIPIALVVALASCARLPEPPAREGTAVAEEQVSPGGTIPAAWGKLVSVSSIPASPETFALWFEDDAGTVRMALYRTRTKTLLPTARVFRRS